MKEHGQNDCPACAGVGGRGLITDNATGDDGQQPEYPAFHRPGCLTIESAAESAAGDGDHLAARKLTLLQEYRALTEGLLAALHTARGQETSASPAGPARERRNTAAENIQPQIAGETGQASCNNPGSLEAELLTQVEKLLAARQETIRRVNELDRQLAASAAPLLRAEEARAALQEIQELEEKSRQLMEHYLQELKNKITRLQAGRRALEYMKGMASGAGKLDTSR
ncbi:flagellar protein FliT [Desulfofundulus thermocisternus]|uniref:flagellar protein FliT n=1 Tax=Desulfofundulus thermocisternus TaxID=42471 RepID=UPI00217D0FCF|nr:flagellar protein FliT [Desulfofundulus thermocisternus]MCS5696633.1 hypothetical protein [Desulfofundulus thermocisternus]